MSKYAIKNAEGAQVAEAELADGVFGIEPNIPVIHQSVVCHGQLRSSGHPLREEPPRGLRRRRQALSPEGHRPCRQGSTRAGQWTGGGVIFGPTPRCHAKRINNKMVKLAMRSVLSGKVADGELVLVDSLTFEKPSTKQAVALLAALGIGDKRVTVVVPDDDVNTYLSFRNLQRVNVIGVSEATTRNLIDNGALVMTADIAKQFEEVLA